MTEFIWLPYKILNHYNCNNFLKVIKGISGSGNLVMSYILNYKSR
jgi:hypothetical protein